MTKSEKKKRLAEIVERLKEYYPNAECALKYDGDEWKLLVMGRLSAQCTDAKVNEVSIELFERFPTARDMSVQVRSSGSVRVIAGHSATPSLESMVQTLWRRLRVMLL